MLSIAQGFVKDSNFDDVINDSEATEVRLDEL
jgi:hypothetical protein